YDLAGNLELPLSIFAVRERTGLSILEAMANENLHQKDNEHKIFKVGANFQYKPANQYSVEVRVSIILGVVLFLILLVIAHLHLTGLIWKCVFELRVTHGVYNLEEI